MGRHYLFVQLRIDSEKSYNKLECILDVSELLDKLVWQVARTVSYLLLRNLQIWVTIFQLLVATVLKADAVAYMDHIKTLTGSEGSSTTGSDFRCDQIRKYCNFPK